MWAPWPMKPSSSWTARASRCCAPRATTAKRWVLLDYGSVIVHVFTQEAHDYYDLEHLWADATVVPASEWMPDEGADEQ